MVTIKSKREFEHVFKEGHRASGRVARVTVLLEGDEGKVAFVAARRLGNAVYRNRCKRVLREAARLSGLPHAGSKVILFATKATHDCRPSEVAEDLTQLVGRATHHGR